MFRREKFDKYGGKVSDVFVATLGLSELRGKIASGDMPPAKLSQL